MSLGEKLRAARVAAGFLSQRDFAMHVGLSRETVSRIERGISKSYTPTLAVWAKACGVSLDDLLDDDIDDVFAISSTRASSSPGVAR